MEEVSCVVVKNGITYTTYKTGLAPLFDWIEEDPDFLNGAEATDKIVGKAAALIYVHCHIGKVHGKTMSKSAVEVFEKYNIEYSYDILTDKIINRLGTGLCPMETVVLDIDDPKEAFEKLQNAVKAMKK